LAWLLPLTFALHEAEEWNNIPCILLLSWHALRNQFVGWRFLGVLYALTVPMLLSTVAPGRTVTPMMQRVHEFSLWLANLLFGAA